MKHYKQWSAAFASYFTFMGVWVAFGPSALMAVSPGAAPLALAVLTLAYFVATPLTRMVWNAWGFARTLVLTGAGVACSLGLAALLPQWLAWCVPLAFFFGSGSMMLCETRLIDYLAERKRGHDFVRARKWGSVGFLAAASLSGAVFSVGGVNRSFTWLLAVCGLLYLASCLALAAVHDDAPGTHAKTPAPSANRAAEPAAEPAAAPDSPASYTSTSRRERWTGCAAINAMRLGEIISTTWFGAYWLATGHSPLETGLLCALPVAAEFVAMWKGTAFLARYSAASMMLLCALVSVLRWLGTPYCSQLWCAIPLQSLHAYSFGFFYPASLLWLRQEFGAGFFRARYATESALRAVTAAVMFAAAGGVIQAYGYSAVYGAGSGLALLSGLWWWRLVRRQQAAKQTAE
ncbi:MAG: MFS transporter [Rhodoferax sp.]|nr:MFS transporter [Rhodoferax sp.]